MNIHKQDAVNDGPRVYPLKGEALTLAAEFNAENVRSDRELKEIQARYEVEVRSLIESANARRRELWGPMVARVGLDPEKTWGDNNVRLEALYVDHGFAAILVYPSTQHPLAALLGVPEKKSGEDTSAVPEGTAVN